MWRSFLLGCVVATSAGASSFECTLDGVPWKTKAPSIFVSSTEGRARLYVHLNENRSPTVSLAVDWAALNGAGKHVVEYGPLDGGLPSLEGQFADRYEKPSPTPEVFADAERRRVRVVAGTFEWEAPAQAEASLTFSITAASADGKRRVVVRCVGEALSWRGTP